MGDYHHFLASMSGASLHQGHGLAGMQPQSFHSSSMSMVTSPIQSPHHNIGYFQAAKDLAMQDPTKMQRGRKKSSAGLTSGAESVKHRRTRSGCFTCRSRRVKCDETRPICERCQKGNRECIYPDPPSSKGSAGPSGRSKDSAPPSTSPPSSAGDLEDDMDVMSRLQTIPDEDEPEMRTQRSKTWPLRISTNVSPMDYGGGVATARQGSETPSQEDNKSSSPSASTVTTGSLATAPYHPADFSVSTTGRPDWSQLPPDFQHYLRWYDENVTSYQYCLSVDADDFFKNILPRVAIQSEALLNAVVGFSAYLSTLQNPNGKLEDFLRYYNRSVSLLLAFLQRKEKHNVTTLITILQLATIEEYLGDWVNLMGHQRAAFEIFTGIFTPQTATQTPLGRICLSWYGRFDNFIAMMGGFPTSLPREYFDAMNNYFQNQVVSTPDRVIWRIAEQNSRLRIITWDMSILYARGSRGQIGSNDFNNEYNRLTQALIDWKDSCDPILTDPKHLVQDFGGRRPDPDDIVDPYQPGILYDKPIFATTLMMVEWNSIMIMHLTQCGHKTLDQLLPDLSRHAYEVCRYFETLELWPQTPKGVLTLIQACLQIASLFLPQNMKHQLWIRRKLALLERLGHVLPLTIRRQMSMMMGDPSCVRWWLPHDEGFSTVLRAVRQFADERNATAVTVQQESVREVRNLFAKLELGGLSSPITDHK